MQRRKFLAGIGSLAAGSAAAMGTGAFSSVTADRSVTVETAGDAQALLSLQSTSDNENGSYASGSGDTITVDLDDVNQGALTTIYDIFTIQNDGNRPAIVYVDPASLEDEDAFDDSVSTGSNGGGIYLDPQVSDMPNGRQDASLGTLPDGTKYTSLTGIGGSVEEFEEDITESNSEVPAMAKVYLLEPGQSFDFGLYIKTAQDVSLDDFSYDMDIVADANLAESVSD